MSMAMLMNGNPTLSAQCHTLRCPQSLLGTRHENAQAGNSPTSKSGSPESHPEPLPSPTQKIVACHSHSNLSNSVLRMSSRAGALPAGPYMGIWHRARPHPCATMPWWARLPRASLCSHHLPPRLLPVSLGKGPCSQRVLRRWQLLHSG